MCCLERGWGLQTLLLLTAFVCVLQQQELLCEAQHVLGVSMKAFILSLLMLFLLQAGLMQRRTRCKRML